MDREGRTVLVGGIGRSDRGLFSPEEVSDTGVSTLITSLRQL
jgi:hypothetical protein